MRMRVKGFFLLACPIAIVLLYLYCECFNNPKEVLYHIYPEVIRGMMILFVYLAYKSYAKEKNHVAVSILLSGVAVVVPLADSMFGRYDRLGMMFEFVWFLWPVLITCLINFCGQKATKNKKYIFGANFFIVLLLAVLLHWFAESEVEEFVYGDLCVPVIWLAESVLWTFVLNCEAQKEQRKRNIMAVWIVSLVVFDCLTLANISYKSMSMWRYVWREWNSVIILCWPVLILFLMEQSDRLIEEDKPHFILKRCLFCFAMVLPLVYLTTNTGLIYEKGSLNYDIGRVFYCLFLTEIMLWGRMHAKWKQEGCRIKTMAFMVVINIGVFIFLLIENERLQNILSSIKGTFSGSVRTASQADWLGYRKAVFRAFFLNDLTVLGSEYRREKYIYAIY